MKSNHASLNSLRVSYDKVETEFVFVVPVKECLFSFFLSNEAHHKMVEGRRRKCGKVVGRMDGWIDR